VTPRGRGPEYRPLSFFLRAPWKNFFSGILSVFLRVRRCFCAARVWHAIIVEPFSDSLAV